MLSAGHDGSATLKVLEEELEELQKFVAAPLAQQESVLLNGSEAGKDIEESGSSVVACSDSAPAVKAVSAEAVRTVQGDSSVLVESEVRMLRAACELGVHILRLGNKECAD